MKSRLLLIALAGCGCSLAQSTVYPAAIGAGYAVNAITAAPGQLITLIVEDIDNSKLSPPFRAPAGQDLPTSLAGITVGYLFLGGPVPILEVQFFSDGCPLNFGSACGAFTAITVQIPFEAQCRLCANGGVPVASVTIRQSGAGAAPQAYAETLPDQVHILTTCDAFLNGLNIDGNISTTGLPCPSVVTHADGSAVSANAPAQPGEELVVYAVGLGQTNPASVTGQLVAKSAPTVTAFTLDFNYHPNALQSRPLATGPSPIFAGTTPGYVGLYQVNFVVPPVPARTPPCVDASKLPLGSNVVQSNLTVSIGGQYSFDGARICVATQ